MGFFFKCRGVAFLKDEESEIWLLFDMFKEAVLSFHSITLMAWQMLLAKATYKSEVYTQEQL